MTPYLLILAVLLGIAPALIAHGKGRNFLLWWIYGVVLGPVALLHVILLRGRPVRAYHAPARRRRTTWKSNWPVALWAAAAVAIAIIAVTAYGLLLPAQFGAPADQREVAVSADRTPPDRTAAAQSAGAETPNARQSTSSGPPPTVRVTVRREDQTPPEEQTARAPTTPVERLPGEPNAAAQPNERTISNTPAAPASSAVAARTTPDPPAVAPAPAPLPKVPPVAATVAPQVASAPNTAAIPPPSAQPPQPTAQTPAVKPAAPKPAPTDVTAVGETVQIVQLALAKRGYDPGPANGRAGRKTQAAIQKFQSDRGLQPTGAIDYTLLENLEIVGPRVHAFRPPPGATPGR